MFSCNVINNGLVPGLPDWSRSRSPASRRRAASAPSRCPTSGKPLTAILARRLTSVDLAVEAALNGDRDLVIEAMIADGAVFDADEPAPSPTT